MRQPHPDDATDFAVTARIDDMIRLLSTQRGISRATVIDELCNGDNKFEHGLNAIAEMFSITRHEVNTRVSAFIEAEKEEQAERAIREALAAEADA